MTLSELAESYQDSSTLCRRRAEALEKQIGDPACSETQRLELRRRVCILYGMARETSAIARHLRTYRREEREP